MAASTSPALDMTPGRVAVVLAAHGDRGDAIARGEANATLLAHRAALAAAGRFRSVSAGVLKGAPSLEAALEEARATGGDRVAVYPLFMADGYFVRQVLPARVAAVDLDCECRILPPLGVEVALPALLRAEALAAAKAAGFDAAAARLLIVGHGSELGPASAEATRRAAAAVAGLGGFGSVATAFLEEPPFLDAALAGAHPPTVIAGFFSGDGLHAGEDLPAAIRDSGARAVYAGPIGGSPAIPGLIAQSLVLSLAGT
jgi:sirohydrochlorin ferrochelatase